MQIDPETGMPVVPEGYFWRVGPKEGWNFNWYDAYSGFGVSLRRGRFHREYRSNIIEGKNPTKGIQDAALKMAESLYYRIAQSNNQAKLTGDYPPKKLEV